MRGLWLAAALCGLASSGFALGHFDARVAAHARAWLPDGGPPTVSIPAANGAPAQRARFWPAPGAEPKPLVVDLHQWSATEAGANGDDTRFDLAVRRAGWNFVRPALGGRNDGPRACCSTQAMAQINAAIDYAKAHGAVDGRAVYVVGVSGGGYTALCAYMAQAVRARAFVAWAPITDLALWHGQHLHDRYGRDVEACTGATADGRLDAARCAARSPMTMGAGQPDTPVYLFAGIDDGFTGSVPITHSVRLFNRLAELYGRPDRAVGEAALLHMMNDRVGEDTGRGLTIAGRPVHLRRDAGNAHLTVFGGGHEMLTGETMALLAQDYGCLRGGCGVTLADESEGP